MMLISVMDHDYCMPFSNDQVGRATNALSGSECCNQSGCDNRTRAADYKPDTTSMEVGPFVESAGKCDNAEPCQTEMSRLCSACGRMFSTPANLKRHFDRIHSNSSAVKVCKYHCERCTRQFNNHRHLRYHIRKDHVGIPLAKKMHSCFMCEQSFARSDLLKHLSSEHNVVMETEKLSFPCLQDFKQWKTKMEERTQCYYTVARGREILSNKIYYSYACHRSGYFFSNGNNIRKMKWQGTKKINSICPSKITVVEEENGECSVLFVKTHVGHQQELEHLFLTQAERQALAEKIASNVPFDTILEEIRNSPSVTEKIRNITKKDLHNVVVSMLSKQE